jgi:hypothetical protein
MEGKRTPSRTIFYCIREKAWKVRENHEKASYVFLLGSPQIGMISATITETPGWV